MEQQINIEQTDTFSIKDNAIHEELDGSIFIFNVHNGEYYELDSTSLFIWKLLKKDGNDFNYICQEVEQNFEFNADVDSEIKGFLNELISLDLIELSQN